MKKILLATALLLTAGAASAQPPGPPSSDLRTIDLITFQGGWNLPIWIAQQKGFFKDNGLHVEVSYTRNSRQLVTELLAGKYQIAVAGIDNVIAYQEGQVSEPIKNADMFAFYGVDNGLLSLVSGPQIKSVAGLQGKRVSVDALTTGYAFVVRDYLERNGLTQDKVQYTSIGSTNDRFNALQEGRTDATLLRTPLNLQAKALGFNIVASGNELGNYQGTTGVTTRSWASANEDALVSYLRGYLRGLDWLYNPANQREAEAILLKNAPGMTETLASAALQELLYNGLQKDGAIDAQGVRNVIKLRNRLGEPRKELADEHKYFDLSYYQQALGRTK